MKGLAFFILAIVFCCEATKITTRWYQLETYTYSQYLTEFRKSYASAEEKEFRSSLFESNLKKIKEHNADNTKTWKQGVNRYTDWTNEEFRRLLGAKKEFLTPFKTAEVQMDVSRFEGTDVDWRNANIITPVKDQGECGSCWSFGSSETLESYWANVTGQLTDLSEQQILDCTPNPDDCGGTGGCGGGTAELAYTQIQKLGGISTEWVYPYISYSGSNFNCSIKEPFAKLNGYTNLPSNQYAPILDHIAQVGPLVINVDASSWSSYESGVFNGCSTTSIDINHVVQLVGFGTDPNHGDYWLVRNSWSPAWGELGYIRVFRSSNPTCGTDYAPGDGTGCRGGPSQITCCGACGILYDALYPKVSK